MSVFSHTEKAQAEVSELFALALGGLVIAAAGFAANILGLIGATGTDICLGILIVVNGAFFINCRARIKEAAALDAVEKLAAGEAAAAATRAERKAIDV